MNIREFQDCENWMNTFLADTKRYKVHGTYKENKETCKRCINR